MSGNLRFHIWGALLLAWMPACTTQPDLPVAPTPSPIPTATATPVPPTPTPKPIPPSTIILLRHAEKAGSSQDPPLSAAGKKRAQTLAYMLQDAGVTAIYTTQFQRTQQTAQPLAKQLGLPIQPVQANEVEEMARQILANPGGVVLAIGHSDSTVTLIRLLAGLSVPAIEIDEFDNLYILKFSTDGSPGLTHLHYGEPDSK